MENLHIDIRVERVNDTFLSCSLGRADGSLHFECVNLNSLSNWFTELPEGKENLSVFPKRIITVIVTVTIIKQRNGPQSWTKILAIAEKKAENVQILVGLFYQLGYEAIYFITNCYYHYYCYNYCCYLC